MRVEKLTDIGGSRTTTIVGEGNTEGTMSSYL